MKKIELRIDDDVYSELKSSIGMKKLTGNDAGLTDRFMSKLISKIEDDKKIFHAKYKLRKNI